MGWKSLAERIREWVYDVRYPGRESTEWMAEHHIQEIDSYLKLLSECGEGDDVLCRSVKGYLQNHLPGNLAHVKKYGRRDTARCLEAKMRQLRVAYEQSTNKKEA